MCEKSLKEIHVCVKDAGARRILACAFPPVSRDLHCGEKDAQRRDAREPPFGYNAAVLCGNVELRASDARAISRTALYRARNLA